MDERKTVTKALAEQYRKGARKDKGRLLDEFVQATGYNRVYAARLLRNFGVRREVAPGLVVEASHRGRWKGPRRSPKCGRGRRPAENCASRRASRGDSSASARPRWTGC